MQATEGKMCKFKEKNFWQQSTQLLEWITNKDILAPSLNTFEARFDKYWTEYLYLIDQRTVQQSIQRLNTAKRKIITEPTRKGFEYTNLTTL